MVEMQGGSTAGPRSESNVSEREEQTGTCAAWHRVAENRPTHCVPSAGVARVGLLGWNATRCRVIAHKPETSRGQSR